MTAIPSPLGIGRRTSSSPRRGTKTATVIVFGLAQMWPRPVSRETFRPKPNRTAPRGEHTHTTGPRWEGRSRPLGTPSFPLPLPLRRSRRHVRPRARGQGGREAEGYARRRSGAPRTSPGSTSRWSATTPTTATLRPAGSRRGCWAGPRWTTSRGGGSCAKCTVSSKLLEAGEAGGFLDLSPLDGLKGLQQISVSLGPADRPLEGRTISIKNHDPRVMPRG